MKKRAIRLLSMLLALLMLTGCSSSILNDPLDRAYRALQRSFISAGRNLVPFDEMEYLRPDMSTISADFDAVNDALESGDIDSVSAALDACYLDYYNFDTMYTLADIRSCQDVCDSYYADAVNWAAENGVTKGISETLFGPDGSCTRAQIVTFLYRAYQGK